MNDRRSPSLPAALAAAPPATIAQADVLIAISRLTRGQVIAELRSMAAEFTVTADTIRSMAPPEPSPYLRQLEERIAAIEYSLGVLAVRAPKRRGAA